MYLINEENKKHFRVCTIEEMHCYFRAYSQMNDNFACFQSCPVECEMTQQNVQLSEAQFGNEMVYEQLQKRVPGWENKSLEEISSYIRENIISFQMSFLDNTVLQQTCSPAVEWTTLFATIGGSIGVGFGFSFVTCFEFIFFIYDYIMVP